MHPFLKATCITALLCSFHILLKAQKANDTFRVFFDLNVDALNGRARNYLDSLNYNNILVPGKAMSIIGYTDYLADDAYNKSLSERRARSVQQYLNSFGIRNSDLKIVVGKGEIESAVTNAAEGIPKDRKVEIVLTGAIDSQKIKKKNTATDVVITLQPGKKKLLPPSSTDPNFSITKIEKGSTFILKNIYFPMGRHFPREDSYPEIDKLLLALKSNPLIRIQIEGHICCVDKMPDAYDLDSHEMDLSVNRARFVYEYLMARGITKNRLSYMGFGKSRPIIADEQTEEEASVNRRVEIRILEK